MVFFFESPCWLEQSRRNNKLLIENYKYLLDFDNVENRVTLINEFKEKIQFSENDGGDEKPISFDYKNKINLLFSHDNRKNFCISIYFWIFNQIPFYSLLLNLDTVDRIIPYAIEIFFCSDMIGNALTGYFSNIYGRKPIMLLGSGISAITSLSLFFYVKYEFKQFGSLLFTIMVFFRFLAGNTVYFYVQELFEPNIVTTAVSYSKIPSKILMIFVPLLIDANKSLFLFLFVITLPIPILLMFTKETLIRR